MTDPLLDAYASLADELNDPGVTLSVRDFDPDMVDLAHQYAKAHGLPFPPSTGDYDRLWETQQRRPLTPNEQAVIDGGGMTREEYMYAMTDGWVS